MQCMQCMFDYPGNFQFCGNCGARLGSINNKLVNLPGHASLLLPREEASAARIQTFGLKALGMFPRTSCRRRSI